MAREFLDPISLRRLVYRIKDELSKYAKRTEIPSKLSELENDSGYITEIPEFIETDPTVPAWAKEPTKPSYTASEVGALPNTMVIPSKVSQLENDNGYLTEHQDISGKADTDYVDLQISTVQATASSAKEDAIYAAQRAAVVEDKMDEGFANMGMIKADKPIITTSTDTALSFEFSANTNTEIRTGELTTISFTFGNGEYAEDYASGLSFDSGETPTAIDYTDSGILNWVGTDCVTSDGLSIFQPSANTHYDIVFYFNGKQFIGLVNGYVPAGGNGAI